MQGTLSNKHNCNFFTFVYFNLSVYSFLELVHSVDIVDEEKTKQGNKN